MTRRIPLAPTPGPMIRLALPLALAALAAASPAAAQDSTAARVDPVVVVRDTTYEVTVIPDYVASRFHASPPLPEEHWAVRAAARAEAMGLAPRHSPAQRAVPREAVAAALSHARERARGRPALEALAEGWWERFLEEFPEYGAPAPRGLMRLGSAGSLGYASDEGRLAPAVGYFTGRQPPQPIGDEDGVLAGVMGGIGVGRTASVFVDAGGVGDDFDLRRWDVTVGAGAFALSAGVGDVGYGYARSGGVVLSPREALPRVEAQTTRPVRLPWVLGYLGDVSAHTFVSRMDEERHPTEPWLWGMRIAARPHERFTIALHRASIFGGEGRPATVGNLARMLVGIVKSDFENQVVSGEVRWRLPTDSLLPVTAYLEWGADDGAGAISEVPGRVAGLFLPALPGVPQVGIGGEYTRFGEACCGHGPWYFNGTFRGNWARGDQPLGHPLGGEGWEGAGYAQAELMRSLLRLDGRFFVRERSESSLAELGGGNLFSPTRTGRSTGGWIEAAFRLFPQGDVRAGWRVEDGDGWREQGLHVQAVVLF